MARQRDPIETSASDALGLAIVNEGGEADLVSLDIWRMGSPWN